MAVSVLFVAEPVGAQTVTREEAARYFVYLGHLAAVEAEAMEAKLHLDDAQRLALRVLDGGLAAQEAREPIAIALRTALGDIERLERKTGPPAPPLPANEVRRITSMERQSDLIAALPAYLRRRMALVAGLFQAAAANDRGTGALFLSAFLDLEARLVHAKAERREAALLGSDSGTVYYGLREMQFATDRGMAHVLQVATARARGQSADPRDTGRKLRVSRLIAERSLDQTQDLIEEDRDAADAFTPESANDQLLLNLIRRQIRGSEAAMETERRLLDAIDEMHAAMLSAPEPAAAGVVAHRYLDIGPLLRERETKDRELLDLARRRDAIE